MNNYIKNIDIPNINSINDILNNIPYGWDIPFNNSKKELEEIDNLIKIKEENNEVIIPIKSDIFKPFFLCIPEKIKLIIIDKEPYKTASNGIFDSDGLALSTRSLSKKLPHALQNIFIELKNNYPESPVKNNGDLTEWAEKGVLLVNQSLTINYRNKEKINNHQYLWMGFIINIINYIISINKNIIFLFLGDDIKKDFSFINSKYTTFIIAHPSYCPKKNSIIGSNIFLLINNKLKDKEIEEIKW